MFASQNKKLLNYSALSSAFLCLANSASGQFVYKDYDPDSLVIADSMISLTIFVGDTPLDLNQDGIVDFSFKLYEDTDHVWGPYDSCVYPSGNVAIVPKGANQFAVETGGGLWYASCAYQPANLGFGAEIGNELNWWYGTGTLYSAHYVLGAAFPAKCGENHYTSIPVRIDVGGDWNYGWLRLSVGTKLLLKEEFISLVPNSPVYAEYHPDSTRLNQVVFPEAEDRGNLGASSDLRVSFSQLNGELGLLEYRVFLVPPGDLTFFMANYLSLPADRYHNFGPTGQINNVIELPAGIKSVDGSNLTHNTEYILAIASISDGITFPNDTLAIASTPFALKPPPPVAINVHVVDDGDTTTAFGSNVRVQFFAPSSETGIDHYLAIVVPDSAAVDLDVFDWKTIPSISRSYIPVGLSVYDFNFHASNVDIFGETIQEGVDYRVLIQSVGTDSFDLAFSAMSNLFRLGDGLSLPDGTPLPVAQNALISDIGTSGGASDIRLRFDPAIDESNIEAYRVFVVPVYMVPLLTVESAFSQTENFLSFLPDGNSKDIVLPDTLLDFAGNAILEANPYQVVILGISEPFWDPISSLSAFSNILTLMPGPAPIEIPDDGDDDDTW